MRAAMARGPGTIVLEEVERPTPGAGDVVVRVGACGICGSDLHWYHDQLKIPQVCPGHEIAGEVAMVGPGVTALRAGDRVSVEGIASCGVCRYCLAGDYHYCGRIGIVGMTIPGGYAEYLKIPARHCFDVGTLDVATAALSEPLGVAVHGVRIAGLRIGQRVVVLGAGTIGLMAVVAARAVGADEGALFEAVGESPVDLVIESVGGTARTLDTAVAICRPGGTICLLGVYTTSVPFPALFTVAKELTIKGSFVYNRAGSRADFDVVVDLLRRHGDRLGATMITHRIPLADVAQAFRTAADKTSGSIKVTVTNP